MDELHDRISLFKLEERTRILELDGRYDPVTDEQVSSLTLGWDLFRFQLQAERNVENQGAVEKRDLGFGIRGRFQSVTPVA